MTKTFEINEEQEFNYVSLFSGIGGFEQALNQLGGNCVLASEIDKYAEQSYQVLYGHATAGDITKIDAEDVPDHDFLVGGFPCQSFSVAGKRGGFEDSRGTLFFEVARLAKTKQPKMILLENVKGLISHDKGKTLDTIIQTLSEIGYTVDFNVLNSKYFGVPQNRERIFIIAVRDDLITPEPWVIEGNTIVPKGKRRIAEYEEMKTFNFDWPEQNEVTTRLRDILETQVDEKYYLSDDKTAALVAQLEDKDKIVGSIGHHPFSKKMEFKGYNDDISPCLIATDYKAPKTILENGLPIRKATKQGYAIAVVGDAVNFQIPNSKTRRGRIGKQIANTLEASAINQGVVEYGEVRPVLTPDRPNKRQNGRRFKEDGEEAFTLTAQDKHGVAISYKEVLTKNIQTIVAKSRPNDEIGITFKANGDIRPHRMDPKKSGISELNNHEDNASFTITSTHAPKIYGESTRYRIRKLTPRECWRLQGFSDEAHQTLVDAGLSDSQRYKQAGNAVTVNVITAIGEKMLKQLEKGALQLT